MPSDSPHRELLVDARLNDQREIVIDARSIRNWDGDHIAHRPRRYHLPTCRYCSTRFERHPGWTDHQDTCRLNPMNRPHIIGEAVAMRGSR